MSKIMRMLSGLAAGVLMAGCAGGRYHDMAHGEGRLIAPALVCPPTACDAYVKVWTDGGGVCRLQLSDDTIEVQRGHKPVLTWQLRQLNPSDGYQYRFNEQTGVAFKDPSRVTLNDFDSNHAVGQDKYRWRSVNGRAGDFYYSVNLERRPNGGLWLPCPVLDPRIVNDGP